MRILVLGATGYIGSRLVPDLVARGHDVTAASSSPPAPRRFGWGDEVQTARVDVTDADEVEVARRHTNDQILLGDNPENEVLPVLSLDRPHLDVLDHCGPVIWVNDRFADGKSHVFVPLS